MQLLEQIKEQIRNLGPMSFDQFMQQALYTPNSGYYTGLLPKIGAAGDFVTAPEISNMFAKTLGNQCKQVLETLHHPIIFEFGAGNGQLCVDLLLHLAHLDSLPMAYHVLEISPDLKAQQQALIQAQLPADLAARVHWLSEWPKKSFQGVVLANEVLDAMPVHRFLYANTEVFEGYIKLGATDDLEEVYLPCSDLSLKDYVLTNFPQNIDAPYQSEVNLFIDGWFQQCSVMLARGLMLIIDYGFPRHEYYHADRCSGTLMCHYKHQAHSNALINVGSQDITAHVDFTHVAESACAAGFQVSGYTSQAAFLLNNGLMEECLAIPDETTRIFTQQAVKKLIQPHEMGELFKVIALTKDLQLELNGFKMFDRRARL